MDARIVYPKVSIIILNWNGLEDTIECLESLKKVTYPNYEVIVVDNASSGSDVQVLTERYEDYIHIIQNDRNYGFAEGNNISMRYALADFNSDYFLLLNNDTVVAPDFLGELVKVALADTRIGIVGPKIYYYDEPTKIWFAGGRINRWTGKPRHLGIGQEDQGQFEDVLDVDFITGCCMLISREVLLSVGLLDKDFFFGNEDYDICIRAMNRGFRILFAPKAKIWHKIGRATSSTEEKPSSVHAYYAAKNLLLLWQKHWSKLQFTTSFLCLLASLPAIIIRFLRYDRQWSTLKWYSLGLLDFLRRK